MANWKLTPVHIDGKMFGITPEWTSGSGCYRVKRFSSVFPFMIHGEELKDSAIQLLRWSSKLPVQDDIAVYLKNNNKIIHLFSAHPFAVEFFRRNWTGTELSKNFIFLNATLVEKYNLGTAECGLANCLSVLGAFKDTAQSMSDELIERNCGYASEVFELCNKHRQRMADIIAPASLISHSIEFTSFLRTATKANPIELSRFSKVVEKENGKTLSATQVSLNKKPKVQIPLSSRNGAEQYIPKERVIPPEELVEFKMGSLLFSKEVEMATYNVFEYGVYFMLSITANGQQSLIPTKSLVEAKSLIRLIAANQEAVEKNHLCVKFSLGGESYGRAMLGRFASAIIDRFNDIWSGTQVGYNHFVSMAPLEHPHCAKEALLVLCQQSHRSKIQPTLAI